MKRALVLFGIFLFILCAATVCLAGDKKVNAVEIGPGITPPKLLEVASPEYTPEAKKAKIEGDVLLTIVIDQNGDVVDAVVKKGLGKGLDEQAIAAVKVWKYKPATKDDEPIAVKMDVTTTFMLHD